MKLQRPNAILFDWDNTLVDTWPTIHAALNHVMQVMGHAPWSLEKTKDEVKQSMRDSFPVMFGDAWEEAATIYQTRYRELHLENLNALPEASKTLDYLRQTDAFIGVVSNKKGPTLRLEIAHLGWEHYFDSIVGAQDAERDKPDPAPVTLALRKADLADSPHIWFIGDSIIDIECAHNTGCIPMLYGPKTGVVDGTLDGLSFAHHALDQAELLGVLQKHLA